MRRLVSPLILVVAIAVASTGCASASNRLRDGGGVRPAASATAEAATLALADASQMATTSPEPSTASMEMTPEPSAPPAAVASPPVVPPQEFDPVVPAVLAGKVHDIDLPIRDVTIEVAPGRTVAAWTFGGTVPGPVIHVTVGDMVRVHLTNETSMTHSIDFHASQVAMNDQMVAIDPGATWTYTFTAEYAGVWMYHCGTGPTLLHIANGMYGMVIVDPAEPLPPVDHEYALVQGEWYLGENGQPTDYAKASEAAPAPDFVVFNGVANQYKDHPLQVAPGDDVRFYVLDAGPNVDSSFHVVGTIFHRVLKEGILMDAATNGGWGSQAVDLAPAQAAIVDLAIPESGMFVFVTHAFNFVQLGAAGILKSGDGMPPSAAMASPAPASTLAPAPTPASAPASSPPAAATGRTIALDEDATLQITQDGQPVTNLTVQEGETIHFVISNSAGFDHDFYIGTADQLSQGQVEGLPGVPTFASGTQEFDYTVTAATADLQFACTVPGHYQLMHGAFTVQP